MSTRNVVLTERQDEFIETLVETGRYQNPSEVLRDGLRLVEQREAEDAASLAALREAARIGMYEFDARLFSYSEPPHEVRIHRVLHDSMETSRPVTGHES